ncbi:putative hydro-lyase [Thermoanaerobacteraceae bacterium SP2]|nr:putative hydro-lyase [Thermoanaerobacteraceae bacterium SP2]
MLNEKMNSIEARKLIRNGDWKNPTAGLAPGYVQTNLVIIPKKYAFDFLLFGHRNSKSCPIIEVTDTGSPHPLIAIDGDLRTDVPKYRIYKKGYLEVELDSIKEYWQDDFVSFLIGCSFTFEKALMDAGIPVRHIEEQKNVPMYITNRFCNSADIFYGPMVVSMRPIPYELVVRTVQITSRFPAVHGAPVHIGDPAKIGIKDITTPDFGDSVSINQEEVPVFWACGVTSQIVIMQAKIDIVITHAPGYMFITDLKDQDLAVF